MMVHEKTSREIAY
ncbi:Protein of unknown function [Bacillus cereus]|nr:Protein of unknown function [Bacillus cereus]